jgi:hypothetical protein
VGIENVNGVRSVLGRARTMAQLRNAIIKQMMSTATDAELIALGERFEKLLLEYVDAWLAWAPLMRAARAEAEADIATLTAAIQRNGCDVAQARMSELERDMQPLAEEIIAARSSRCSAVRRLHGRSLRAQQGERVRQIGVLISLVSVFTWCLKP